MEDPDLPVTRLIVFGPVPFTTQICAWSEQLLDQAAPSVRQGISALRPRAAAGDPATPAQDMRISAVALAIERSI
jgi:hypothetical protein